MEIKDNKICCKCWCVNRIADDKNREMGMEVHDTEDTWEEYAFDLNQVMSLKQTGLSEFIKNGEATTIVFKNQEIVSVDISFLELWEVWTSSYP